MSNGDPERDEDEEVVSLINSLGEERVNRTASGLLRELMEDRPPIRAPRSGRTRNTPIQDVDAMRPTVEETAEEFDEFINRVIAQPENAQRSSRGRTTKSSGAIVWIDSAKGVVNVRAPFHADFNILNRPLHGRKFIKEPPSGGYWEFSATPGNIQELLKILALCYKNISRGPLELIELWELLETDDIAKIYSIVKNRYTGHVEILKKIDETFANYIDLEKAFRKVRRVIRTT